MKIWLSQGTLLSLPSNLFHQKRIGYSLQSMSQSWGS